jgi:hypothetical protein
MKSPRFKHAFRSPVFWLVIAGCLLSVSVVVAGPGPGPKGKDAEHFLGFWEGIDPLDGSPVRVSLSDIEGDGIVELTLQEDFWSVCFDLGPGYSRGRGIVRGTATVASKTVLDVQTELICFSDGNVPNSLGVASVQYTLRSHDRVLVLPSFGDSPAIVLHRISH